MSTNELAVQAADNVIEEAKTHLFSQKLSSGIQRALHSWSASRAGEPKFPGSARELAALIDHTLLRPDATETDLNKLCDEALEHGFASVCVNGVFVKRATHRLKNAKAKPTTVPIAVVGFPLGAGTARAKAFETRAAIEDGAREIDMVISLGALKSGDYEAVFEDISAVVESAARQPVKVILETALLTSTQKAIACFLAMASDAAFVKTSTGFGGGGATADDVFLMRRIVGDKMGVKASGGIRTTVDALRMIRSGATRIGASSSVAIVEGFDAGGSPNGARATNEAGGY